MLRDVLAAAVESGKSRLIAQTQFWIGQAALATGDLTAAKDAFDWVYRLYPEPSGTGHAYAMLGLGVLALRSEDKDLAAAKSRLILAAKLARDGADAVLEGRAKLAIAELQDALGEPGARLAALVSAVSCFRDGSVYLQAQALSELAAAEADAGNEGAARAARDRVDGLYADMGLPEEDQIHRQRLQPVR